MRLFTWLLGMHVAAGEIFFHLEDKWHLLSYVVVQSESAELERSPFFLPPSPTSEIWDPENPNILRASLKNSYLPRSLSRAVHKSTVSVALHFFLITSNAKQLGEKRHICWFLLNCGSSWCVFLQQFFGTGMENWTWSYWYFQCGKHLSLLQEVFQCTTEKGNLGRMQCWNKTSSSTEHYRKE